jgi:hypothetical protein
MNNIHAPINNVPKASSSNPVFPNNQISHSTFSGSLRKSKKKGRNSNDKTQSFDQKIETK